MPGRLWQVNSQTLSCGSVSLLNGKNLKPLREDQTIRNESLINQPQKDASKELELHTSIYASETFWRILIIKSIKIFSKLLLVSKQYEPMLASEC
jgi:hypothetical protein